MEQPKAFSELRKGEVNELRRHLGNISVRRNKKQLKEVIKKVIAYMTLGINVSRLFSEMVMACQSAEIVIKKMVMPHKRYMDIKSKRSPSRALSSYIQGVASLLFINVKEAVL